jgi:hypothetical protein
MLLESVKFAGNWKTISPVAQLPEFRMHQADPFSRTGVDFSGSPVCEGICTWI